MSPEKDPAPWLTRLSVDEWLAAAETELALAAAAFARRAVRPGVTHARRAAGMAWNAVLIARPAGDDDRYGRSYMDHVVALAADAGAPPELRAAAARLRDTPAAPPALVTIGKVDSTPVDAARAIVAHARALARAAVASEPRGTGGPPRA